MKLKKWEIVLIIILALSVCTLCTAGALSHCQTELSDKLIRLHVIANSDSESDQSMKLYVRDAVTSVLEAMLEGAETRAQAAEVIVDKLGEIQSAAQHAVFEYGGEYGVQVTLGTESYPTREYDTFTLPAGEYTSLKITIGEGEGKNWWCVVFPPVCFAAATDDELAEMNFSDGEIEFITGKGEEYEFRFKLLEQLEAFKLFFKKI